MIKELREVKIDRFWKWLEPDLNAYSQAISDLLETLTDEQLEKFLENRSQSPEAE